MLVYFMIEMDSVNNAYLLFFIQQYRRIKIPLHAPNACVIVEPRKHPFLELVVKNIMYFLPHWSLYIFHSTENQEFVRTIVGPTNADTVHFHVVCPSNLTTREYNELLMSPSFWNKINAEDILIFQTDSYIRRSGIESFLLHQFCMIGAPWSWFGNRSHTGNGGFSLRKKSAMLRILAEHPYQNCRLNEDLYFNQGAVKLGMRVPSPDVSKFFSVESIHADTSYATHQPWTFQHPFQPIDTQSSWLVHLPADRSFLHTRKFPWAMYYSNGHVVELPNDQEMTLHVDPTTRFFCGNTDVSDRVKQLLLVMVPRDKSFLGLANSAPTIRVLRGCQWIRNVGPDEDARFGMDPLHPLCFCVDEVDMTESVLHYNTLQTR